MQEYHRILLREVEADAAPYRLIFTQIYGGPKPGDYRVYERLCWEILSGQVDKARCGSMSASNVAWSSIVTTTGVSIS
jgi:hypothetical protein